MGESTAALVVEDLHKKFGALEVLKGISLSANDGDVIAMIGSSGSGKSTFLRCINLLETPDSGRIYVAGELIKMRSNKSGQATPADAKQVDRIRAELAMVFQSFNLWSHMTVLENVIEAPIHVLKLSRAEAIARAEALLTKVGIADKRSYYRATSPAGSSSGPPSPGRSPCSPRSCCSTSPPRRWIPSWWGRCCASCASSPKRGRQ
jgi:ABC-type histidine transport system ATPase subunit